MSSTQSNARPIAASFALFSGGAQASPDKEAPVGRPSSSTPPAARTVLARDRLDRDVPVHVRNLPRVECSLDQNA